MDQFLHWIATPNLAPRRIGDGRQVGHARSPICTTLKPTLTKRRILQPTLTRIAEDCDRVNWYISTASAAADYEK
jgi:hypothetical protein